MDIRVISYVLGKLSLALGCTIVLPLVLALYEGEGSMGPISWTIVLCVVVGVGLVRHGRRPVDSLTIREGIAITTLGWVLVTFLGALPYALGGYLPLLDSIFECISGLSGTGATVFPDIESIPESIVLWRALTHWLGGLGIIVIFIALFPQFSRGVVHMFNAESTGPTNDRSLPRIKETAQALFLVYLVFTVVCTVVLMACGMNFVIAVDHAFATIATGGFSPYNTSVAHFDSPVIEGWLAFFMIISSANIGMYIAAWQRGVTVIVKDTEFRCYLALVFCSTLLMTANLVAAQDWTMGYSLRQTFFQAAAISSSTGYVSYDFEQWPSFSKLILLVLMFIGGCAGSTAGGLKVTRVMLLCKTIVALVRKQLHPQGVVQVRSNGDDFAAAILWGVGRFFFVYVLLDVLWTAILVVDGVPIFDAASLSISAMGSCGPGFGLFGATATCAPLPPVSKAVISLAMLMGRLESFPVLVLCMPSFWRKHTW